MIENIANDHLHFHAISDNAPAFTCNMCGLPTKRGFSPQIATIHPYVDNSMEYSVVVCSDLCKKNLISHEYADDYILGIIIEIASENRLAIKEDWALYYNQRVKKFNENGSNNENRMDGHLS